MAGHANVIPGPLLVTAVTVAVAVAFADSSIVVLALPELYASFDTTIEGVAWVVTSYNLLLAVCALAIVLLAHRVRASVLLAAGSVVFLAASLACALADDLMLVIAARSVQGLGGALLLGGSLPVLGSLVGSTARAVGLWTMAATFGAAVGPALGGVLTQAFDWRAIFVFQAPVAAAALLATVGTRVAAIPEIGSTTRKLRQTLRENLALALLSGALVGTLFLGVLLVIDVFGYTPIQGAAVVSAIPVATLLARPLSAGSRGRAAVVSGAALLASGLLGLALLPSSDLAFTLASFVLCGFGLGLAVPDLTDSALDGEGDVGRKGSFTVGFRHLGLVLALAIVAPLLGHDLLAAARVAELNATAVIIDGAIPATTKVPLALDISHELDEAPRGDIPTFIASFDRAGMATDEAVRAVHDDMVESIEGAVTRGFRRSFLFCAFLAALALVPVVTFRRRRAG
jgi:MFS family permease